MTTAVAVDPGDSRIWLLWKQGNNTADIAQKLGVSEASIANRIQHIREARKASMSAIRETIEHQRAARARLRNPPNGRDSSELEVVSAYTFRRIVSEASIIERKVKTPQEIAMSLLERYRFQLAEWVKGHGLSYSMPPDGPAIPRNQLSEIIGAVAEETGLPRERILSPRRQIQLVRARHVICYLARKHTALSLPAIGRQLGDRDHTTILHAADKVEELLAVPGNDDLRKLVHDVEVKLKRRATNLSKALFRSRVNCLLRRVLPLPVGADFFVSHEDAVTGIFRFIRHHDVADRLDEGWRYAAHLGRTHGAWSVLMWWCCGACEDGEAP